MSAQGHGESANRADPTRLWLPIVAGDRSSRVGSFNNWPKWLAVRPALFGRPFVGLQVVRMAIISLDLQIMFITRVML